MSYFIILPKISPAPTRRSGFNLVEAAIVLGVVGLIIGGIWVAANAVNEQRRVSQTVSNILQIEQNVRRLFPQGLRSNISIVQLMTTDLSNSGLFQGTDISSGVDSWNVRYGLQQLDENHFTISMTPETAPVTGGYWPVPVCIKVISRISARADSNLQQISFNNHVGYIEDFPFMPTAEDCTEAPDFVIRFKW